MSTRVIKKDELIAVWLQREFKNAWPTQIKPIAEFFGLNLEKTQRIVLAPKLDDEIENHFRLQFFQSRMPLLRPIMVGNWREEEISEPDFKELRVIPHDPSWMYLSNNTGKLSTVAEKIYNGQIQNPSSDIQRNIQTINSILKTSIDTRLFLIERPGSNVVTILEGNKNAVALYINHFLSKKSTFQPFKVFRGYIDPKDFWQW